MVIELLVTKNFEEALERYPHKKVVYKAIGQLLENPRSTGIQAHRYGTGRRWHMDSLHFRWRQIIYQPKEKALYLWNLGSHDIERANSRGFAANTRFSRMEWTPDRVPSTPTEVAEISCETAACGKTSTSNQ